MAELQQMPRCRGLPLTLTPKHQQTPCHRGKVNKTRGFCIRNRPAAAAIDAVAADFSAPGGGSPPHCSRALRVLRDNRSAGS
jgi:hypothetical protein